jgi:hypothetical protein
MLVGNTEEPRTQVEHTRRDHDSRDELGLGPLKYVDARVESGRCESREQDKDGGELRFRGMGCGGDAAPASFVTSYYACSRVQLRCLIRCEDDSKSQSNGRCHTVLRLVALGALRRTVRVLQYAFGAPQRRTGVLGGERDRHVSPPVR